MSDFDFSDRTRKQIDYAKIFNEIPNVVDGYVSPIETVVSQLQTEFDNGVMRAVQNVGINVDKDELVKALDYDRKQYEQGYRNGYERGYAQAKEDIANMLSNDSEIMRLLDIKSPSKCSQCKHMGDIDYCSNCHSDHSLFEEYSIKKEDLINLIKNSKI